MGVHPSTIRNWHQRRLFPLIMRGVTKRAPPLRAVGCRVCFTTERLIFRWLEQLALAQWRGRYEATWRARRENPQELPRQTVSGNS
jgi:hypothetical protein